DFIDAPDRRLIHAATQLVQAQASQPGTQVTVVLPRRSYAPLLGRLLHDRTADKIAGAVSRIPHSAATIVPFDVRSRLQVLADRHADGNGQAKDRAAVSRQPANGQEASAKGAADAPSAAAAGTQAGNNAARAADSG